jgi:signal transduction histidine kinase
MAPQQTFPLPRKQYRWYILFFNLLMLGSLGGALILTLWTLPTGLGWHQIVTAGLLVVQIVIYLGMIRFIDWPPPQRTILLYFAVALGLWTIEVWLTPAIWWLGFAFVGQMFGMLPLWGALAGTGYTFLIMYGLVFSPEMSGEMGWNWGYGMLAQWVSITVIFVFLNQLIRTSQERGQLIADLEAAQEELRAAQAREAELAVLRERERLARDLHDSLGHALVALSVQLEAVQRLYRVDSERASDQVDEMKVLTRRSMDALRRSIAGLRAPELGDRELRPALQALCVDFGQRVGLTVACKLDVCADDLCPAVTETVWRVVQEALTNVEKHAQAERVVVRLACEPEAVVLRVADDGVGLPEEAEAAANHFGLRGMRERVTGLGGTLALYNDDGAVVEARLPVIKP